MKSLESDLSPLPCPFCGSTNLILGPASTMVKCRGCGARTLSVGEDEGRLHLLEVDDEISPDDYETQSKVHLEKACRQLAIEAWNQRSSATNPQEGSTNPQNLSELVLTAQPYLLGYLAASAPAGDTDLQQELMIQCPGIDVANVAIVQVLALAELLKRGAVVEHLQLPEVRAEYGAAWELADESDLEPDPDEFSVPIPSDPDYDCPQQVWEPASP